MQNESLNHLQALVQQQPLTFFEFAKKRGPQVLRIAIGRAAKEWEAADSDLSGRKKL